MRAPWVSIVGGLAASVACQITTSSKNIRSEDIAMEAAVTADGSGLAVVTAKLEFGGRNTHVLLDCHDSLVARANDHDQEMERPGASCDDHRSSAVTYEASFELDDRVTEFQVSLIRSRHEDAVANVGVLPEPFEITSVFDATPLSRSDDDVEFTWEPPGTEDEMVMEVERLGCFFLERKEIDGDSGSLVLRAGELLSSDPEMSDSCEAQLTLWRTRAGGVDGLLHEDSEFLLQQSRSTSFVSGP